LKKLAQWLLEEYPDWKPGDGAYHHPLQEPDQAKARQNGQWDFDHQSIYPGATRQPVIDGRGFNHGYRNKPKMSKGRDEIE